MRIRQRAEFKQQKSTSDWKDHPLVVAAVSASASMVFMSTVVMPIQSTYLNNKMNEMENQLNQTENKIKQIDEIDTRRLAAEKKQKETEQELSTTKAKLLSVLHTNAFKQGSPYPRFIDKVKVGDKFSKIFDAYTNNQIEVTKKKDGTTRYVSLKINDHPFITDITFYPDDGNVSQILYFLTQDNGDMLHHLLSESLGRAITGSNENEFYWKLSDQLFVSKNSEKNFVISRTQHYQPFKTLLQKH